MEEQETLSTLIQKPDKDTIKKKITGQCLWFRRRQWHPTPVLLPGKSQGWGSLVGCLYMDAKILNKILAN